MIGARARAIAIIRRLLAPLAILAGAQTAHADPLGCDMASYRAQPALTASAAGDDLLLEWTGDGGDHLRLRIGVDHGTPVLRELAIRDGGWRPVLRDAVPEFTVTTGLRRISNQQLAPLRGLGVAIDQATIDKYRWDPFWDAPLYLGKPGADGRFAKNPPPAPGIPGTDQPGLPRDPAEIAHDAARFAISGCAVRADGGRIVVALPGVTLGAFDGELRFTVFAGSNLIRMEIAARTSRSWVAYKFDAGLGGLRGDASTTLRWHDIGGNAQNEATIGVPDDGEVPLAARNRLLTMAGDKAALSLFPEPHRFFWAREVAVNMAYSWFRRDSRATFAFGIRQSDHETDEEDPSNWALYSARPGTEQHMALFLYPKLGAAAAAEAGALAFTHGDTYTRLPGYQVMSHHHHMDLGERLLASGSPDTRLPDLVALRALGINIVSQVDSITWGSPATDPLAITASSVEGARRHSDANFRILPSQELFNSPLGGHTDLLFDHPVYWDQRDPGQPLSETLPRYGKVYHLGSSGDLMAMVRAEGVMLSMPHPRTKGSTGFPDAIRDKDTFADPHFDSVGMRWGMGLDGSETRLCDYRCWPLLDDMSNWLADRQGPLKHVLAISEVRHVQPGDDIYASQPVSYVKLAALPPPGDDAPILDALRHGDSFWTTGEVLIPDWRVERTGAQAKLVAQVSWTFPLDFVEVVWGDGTNIGRKTVSTTQLPANGGRRFEIPFDAPGARWVRFAAWDIAGNGAVTQPVRIDAAARRDRRGATMTGR